ncbi:beta-lactamase/transpeptidase-like protein [Apiosordaria backusii]|uniref:Beta-lactamase/transpeptidase-like protein n=1 Tax=Apiosordaria backusii TaxID=314023 RepID=A0AA40BRD4_9PEZI|nr:beta-lactamase/transpeptidase-like protein [Apiosordaria backusii]
MRILVTPAKPTLQRLQFADAQIDEICRVSGVAGASVGVVRNGTLIHTHYYGFSDIKNQIPADVHTVYGIGSVTKSFISATIAQLVHESKGSTNGLTFDTPVRDVLPEFNHDNPIINNTLTLTDILTHRSGLASLGAMNLAFQGDGDMLLPKDSLFQIVNHLKPIFPLRQSWSYFVWGYAIAGAIIEKIAGQPLAQAVAERLFRPLGMNETYFNPADAYPGQLARPYAGLSDGSAFPLPKMQVFEGTFFEASGGIYSSLHDMSKWCSTMLRSIRDAREGKSGILKEVPYLISNLIPIQNPSIRERSYGLGWIRTQLPGLVGIMGDNAGLWSVEDSPILGTDDTPVFMLYHQGSTVGYFSHVTLFPDIDTSVVILTNSISLSDAADWISRTVIQALLGLKDGNDYVALAKEANKVSVAEYDQLAADLDRLRTTCSLDNTNPARGPAAVRSLGGRYLSKSKPFFIDILPGDSDGMDLKMRFQGLADQTYDLRTLCGDTYEWGLTHDQSKKRGRYNQVDLPFYLINFDEAQGSLSWTVDPDLPKPEGDEVFWKIADGDDENQKPLS